jgi:hypothetical protein
MEIKAAIQNCYDVANQLDDSDGSKKSCLQIAHWLEELVSLRKVLGDSKELDKRGASIKTNIFDKEEIIENCTVQILTNSDLPKNGIQW